MGAAASLAVDSRSSRVLQPLRNSPQTSTKSSSSDDAHHDINAAPDTLLPAGTGVLTAGALADMQATLTGAGGAAAAAPPSPANDSEVAGVAWSAVGILAAADALPQNGASDDALHDVASE